MPFALAAGAGIPHATFTGDAGRLLITFMGLVSASILPTVFLIIGSMTASGRSVKAINDLEAELSAAMDALFLLFGLVALAVMLMLFVAAPLPLALTSVRHLEGHLHRAEQAALGAVVVLIVLRSGQIPAILRRALAIRREIALDEARRKIVENAPTTDTVRQVFAKHENFGRLVNLSDLESGERR